MTTIEDKILEPRILKKLKKEFEEFYGKDIPFQYIETGELDNDFIYLSSGLKKKVDDVTDEEFISYVNQEMTLGNAQVYSDDPLPLCEICGKELIGEYPLTNNLVYELDTMNKCDDCRKKYFDSISRNENN